MEKVVIEISDVLDITKKGVLVIVKKTGKPLNLPLGEIERRGNYVFLPIWLYNKIFNKEASC